MSEYKVTTISVEKEIPEDIKRAGRRFFYDFTLNIKVAYELGLDRLGFDHDDLIILQAIGKMMASDSFAKTEIPGMNGKWIWIAHQKLLDECPFLRIKKDMLKKRLADMEKHGLIRRHLKDYTMPMYQPGDHFDKLVYGRGRESISGGVGNSLPGGRESITDNDSYSYDLNSNDKIKSDLGKSSSPNASLRKEKDNQESSLAGPRLYDWFYERLKARGALPTDAKGKVILHKHGRASATAIEAQVGYDMAVKVYEWAFKDKYVNASLSNWTNVKMAYDKSHAINYSHLRAADQKIYQN